MNSYSYSETSGGQGSNLYFNVVHFFNNSVNYIYVTRPFWVQRKRNEPKSRDQNSRPSQ